MATFNRHFDPTGLLSNFVSKCMEEAIKTRSHIRNFEKEKWAVTEWRLF
jgi:hypothetical protein